jgi:hypothetical protein
LFESVRRFLHTFEQQAPLWHWPEEAHAPPSATSGTHCALPLQKVPGMQSELEVQETRQRPVAPLQR